MKRFLLDGFNLKYVDNHGQSLLDWAIVCGTAEIVECILSQCKAEEIFDLTTALVYATAYRKESICRVLLDYGADPCGVAANDMGLVEGLEKPNGWSYFYPLFYKICLPTLERSPKTKSCDSSHAVNLPICPSEADMPGEKQLFIFSTEIFPVLIDVFEQTSSEAIK